VELNSSDKTLIGIITFLSLLDLAFNGFNAVPYLGALTETASEGILETIQVGLTLLLANNNAPKRT